jgi:hypothetical protein
VRLAFWIALIAVALVLGGISLGAYLLAARKLYSKDREVVERLQHDGSAAEDSDDREGGGPGGDLT